MRRRPCRRSSTSANRSSWAGSCLTRRVVCFLIPSCGRVRPRSPARHGCSGGFVIASVASSTLFGVEGRPVSIEVHVSSGLPAFTVVGLPDAACRESRDRVRAALLSSGLPWPMRRVTVNLAPSGVRKGGVGLDLPIAVALLVAAEHVPAAAVDGCAFLGELGLDGSVRRIAGVLPLVDALNARAVVVPRDCAPEASLVARVPVRGVSTLTEVVDALRGRARWPNPAVPAPAEAGESIPDMS